MSECRCGRETRDEAYVCDTCVSALNRALGDVPWLDDELETTITRQRAAATTGAARSAQTGLPWHERASETRRTLHGLLVSWVRFCGEENVRGLPTWEVRDTLPSLSRFLLNCTRGLTFLDIGPEAVEEITDAVAACERMIDRHPEREYAGPCECGRDLYRAPGERWVRCKHCNEQTDTEELLAKMRGAVMGRYVTAREGAGLLSKFGMETQQGTIDKWRERKRILDHGSDHRGHRLYLFDDLIALATRNTSAA